MSLTRLRDYRDGPPASRFPGIVLARAPVADRHYGRGCGPTGAKGASKRGR